MHSRYHADSEYVKYSGQIVWLRSLLVTNKETHSHTDTQLYILVQMEMDTEQFVQILSTLIYGGEIADANFGLPLTCLKTSFHSALAPLHQHPAITITSSYFYASAPQGGGIKRCFCLTSVCCVHRAEIYREIYSREQRGLGRLKLAQRQPTSYVTRAPLSRSEGQRSTCCGCLKQPTCRNRCHLANKCEDIVNLQGAEAYCVARAQLVLN